MLEVKVVKGNIEKAIKQMKNKVRNTKQTLELRDRESFTKDSVVKRAEKSKAEYIQKKRDEENY